MSRDFVFGSLALLGFAANSLLCRRALGNTPIDPATFTAVRLVSGAATLTIICAIFRESAPRGGSWISAVALFVYAAAFSAAYVRIGAGVGAILLFGAVQATMLSWGIYQGERLRPAQWVGFILAIGGLVFLNLKGNHAPDAIGATLMIGAGVAWGVYSLRGRGSGDPLRTTADNFLRSVALTAIMLPLSWRSLHWSLSGAWLAIASGAIASGVGYSLWYAALPRLGASRAAAVQLAVPVLTASAAVLLLGEHATIRLIIAGSTILLGVGLAVFGRAARH